MLNLKRLNFFRILLVLSFVIIFSSSPGQTFVYDDFNGPVIDPSKWVDVGPNAGLFSQPGKGYLYFNDPAGVKDDALRSSYRWDMPFFLALQYSNFQATNTQTAAFKSSILNLAVGDPPKYAMVYEAKKGDFQGFQAASSINGVLAPLSDPVSSTANKGWLGVGFNGVLGAGGELTFWYDAGKGWNELASYAPNYANAPYFLIEGMNLYGTSLSFKVSKIDLFPGNLAPYKNKNVGSMIDNIASKIDNAAVETAPSAEQILSFFDEKVGDTTLTGKGPVTSADSRRETLRKTIEKARDQIAAGNLKAAVNQLKNAYKKTDGDSNDFVQGGAADDLAKKILNLKTSLEQTISLASLKKMIGAANDKLADGKRKPAENQISNAYKKTYYSSYGFVDDEEAAELAQMILDLKNSLGQTTFVALNTSNTSHNPVPPTLLLFGSGLVGIAGVAGWRRFRRS